MKKPDYELLSVAEMRRKYGLTVSNRPVVSLDPGRVPTVLHHLIPLAEFWGIGDDLIRADLLRTVSPAAITELRLAVTSNEDLLDDWLAGPEANSTAWSAEYLAFSAMRMAADGV